MEILGIGWQELIFIVIIALIVLGPTDMQKAGRSLGRWLNQLVQSDGWKVFQRTSSELRSLPRNLMREANMEMRDVEKEIRGAIDPRLHPPTPSSRSLPPSKGRENTTPGEPPAGETDAPAAVPGGESSATPSGDVGTKDGAGSA